MRTLICMFPELQSSPGDEGGVSCSSSDNSTASSAFSAQHKHIRNSKQQKHQHTHTHTHTRTVTCTPERTCEVVREVLITPELRIQSKENVQGLHLRVIHRDVHESARYARVFLDREVNFPRRNFQLHTGERAVMSHGHITANVNMSRV